MDYHNSQNQFIETIILVLVLLSITNTIGMSIFERTGEIGTFKAIGNTNNEIIQSLYIEGFFLGVIGGFAGCLLGFFVSGLINALSIPMVIPGSSVPLPIKVDMLMEFTSMRCCSSLL